MSDYVHILCTHCLFLTLNHLKISYTAHSSYFTFDIGGFGSVDASQTLVYDTENFKMDHLTFHAVLKDLSDEEKIAKKMV